MKYCSFATYVCCWLIARTMLWHLMRDLGGLEWACCFCDASHITILHRSYDLSNFMQKILWPVWYYMIPWDTVRYHTVSQGITRYHGLSHSITMNHKVSHSITKYHKVSRSITQYHTESQGITRANWNEKECQICFSTYRSTWLQFWRYWL